MASDRRILIGTKVRPATAELLKRSAAAHKLTISAHAAEILDTHAAMVITIGLFERNSKIRKKSKKARLESVKG